MLQTKEIMIDIKPKHIYIDCTDIYLSNFKTGIYRVVINITERVNLISSYSGVECSAVIVFYKWYIPININTAGNSQKIFALSKKIYLLTKGPFKFIAEKLGFSQDKIYITYNFLKYKFKNLIILITHIKYIFIKNKKITPFSGDLLIIPGAFWNSTNQIRLAKNFAKSGGYIIPIIHDLIPINFPQYYDPELVRLFRKALDSIIPISKGIITVSKSILNELETYINLNHKMIENPPFIDYFYLGCDVKSKNNNSSSNSQIRNALKALLGGDSVYIMVGTIEPRKDHITVIEAFEKLWTDGKQYKLVIIGQIGWKNKEILHKIKTNKYLNKYLFVFNNINDAELAMFYRKSKALIFASKNEGFGLPLIEAMQYKIPIIASDIPIFREIAGNYPVYFSVGSSNDLARAILNIKSNYRPGELSKNSVLLTWDESIKIFTEKILNLYKKIIIRDSEL